MSNADPAPQQNAENEDDRDFVQRQRRARVYKKGKMVFQNGLRSIPCVVRNISEGGAMLEFEQPYMLPKQFELYIDLEDYEVSCERRWEEGLKCGVMFTSIKRHVAQQRAQTLKPSETALDQGVDPFRGENDLEPPPQDEAQEQGASEEKPRRNPPSGGHKPAFGKRR